MKSELSFYRLLKAREKENPRDGYLCKSETNNREILTESTLDISVHQPSIVKASVYSILSVYSLVYCGDHFFTPTTFNRR